MTPGLNDGAVEEALGHLKDANSLAKKSSNEARALHVTIATIYDIRNEDKEAMNYYGLGLQGEPKGIFEKLASLRKNADYQAEKMHFAIAKKLYTRQVELLERAPQSALAKSNALSQTARMYKFANRAEQSRGPYQRSAISFLKRDPSQSGQVSQLESEMNVLSKKQ